MVKSNRDEQLCKFRANDPEEVGKKVNGGVTNVRPKRASAHTITARRTALSEPDEHITCLLSHTALHGDDQ